MLLVISCAQYLTKARSNFWPGIAPIHLYPLISRMFFWYSESFSSFPLPSLPFHNPFVCFSIGEWCFSFGVSFRWSWASVDLGFFTYRGPRLFTFKPSHKNRWKRFLAADRQTVHGCIKNPSPSVMFHRVIFGVRSRILERNRLHWRGTDDVFK